MNRAGQIRVEPTTPVTNFTRANITRTYIGSGLYAFGTLYTGSSAYVIETKGASRLLLTLAWDIPNIPVGQTYTVAIKGYVRTPDSNSAITVSNTFEYASLSGMVGTQLRMVIGDNVTFPVQSTDVSVVVELPLVDVIAVTVQTSDNAAGPTMVLSSYLMF